jgi:hypothetical protein
MSFNVPSPADRLAQAGVNVRDAPEVASGGRQRPLNFAVTATQRQGKRSPAVHGRGDLQVSPGTLAFVPFNASDGLGQLVHHGDRITLVTAWLSVPWARTFLTLKNDGSAVRIAIPTSVRRRLRRALASSGITVRRTAGWRAPPLPKMRRPSSNAT